MTSTPQPSPDGDRSIGYQLEVGALTTFLLATIAVTLRVFARGKHAKLGWDDAFMIIALVSYEAFSIRFCILQI